MMKLANRETSKAVHEKILFKANNIFSENYGNLYIVYSYGHHWPMFVFDRASGVWYENEDKYSVTTSKHRSQSHPRVDTVKLSLSDIRERSHNAIS